MSKDKQDLLTEEIIEEPLGDDDIRQYLPDAKIMRYNKLHQYTTIEDLLSNPIDYAILLYEDKPMKGHWVCVLRYNDTVEFFDSYGGSPDSQLKWNKNAVNQELNQQPFLTNLFDLTTKEVIYNPIRYQDSDNDINTCGRHCVFRILNLIEMDRTLEDYYDIMKEVKEETDYPYDDIVANLINII